MTRIKPLDPLLPWAAFLSALGAGLIVAGILGAEHHWPPQWSNYLSVLVGSLMVGYALGMLYKWRFAKHRDLRRALLALLAERRGEAWLNRDEHLVFGSARQGLFPAQSWSVVRLSEDLQRELDTGEAVRTAVAFEQFVIFPFMSGVVRSDEAMLMAQDEAGTITGGRLPGTPGTIRSLWRTLRMPRGMGTTRAHPEEVLGLLGQLRAAERAGDFEQR